MCVFYLRVSERICRNACVKSSHIVIFVRGVSYRTCQLVKEKIPDNIILNSMNIERKTDESGLEYNPHTHTHTHTHKDNKCSQHYFSFFSLINPYRHRHLRLQRRRLPASPRTHCFEPPRPPPEPRPWPAPLAPTVRAAAWPHPEG